MSSGIGAGAAALESAALISDFGLAITEELITDPSEAARQFAEGTLVGAVGESGGLRDIHIWDQVSTSCLKEGADCKLSFSDARAFMLWRNQMIIDSAGAVILEDLDHWEALASTALNAMSLLEPTGIVAAANASANAAHALYVLLDTILSEHPLWEKMDGARQKITRQLQTVEREFLGRLGLLHRTDFTFERPDWYGD